MEIVNIKCHIEAKVSTSWTGRQEVSKQNCKIFLFNGPFNNPIIKLMYGGLLQAKGTG